MGAYCRVHGARPETLYLRSRVRKLRCIEIVASRAGQAPLMSFCQAPESFLNERKFTPGTAVRHQERGWGKILTQMPDGRIAVVFRNGDMHRYTARQLDSNKFSTHSQLADLSRVPPQFSALDSRGFLQYPSGSGLELGSRVTHLKRGQGTIETVMPDRRLVVLFDNGELHRYRPEDWSKLTPVEGLDLPRPPQTGLYDTSPTHGSLGCAAGESGARQSLSCCSGYTELLQQKARTNSNVSIS